MSRRRSLSGQLYHLARTTNTLEAEKFPPDGGDSFFNLPTWGVEGPAHLRGKLRYGQGSPIKLSVRRHG